MNELGREYHDENEMACFVCDGKTSAPAVGTRGLLIGLNLVGFASLATWEKERKAVPAIYTIPLSGLAHGSL